MLIEKIFVMLYVFIKALLYKIGIDLTVSSSYYILGFFSVDKTLLVCKC